MTGLQIFRTGKHSAFLTANALQKTAEAYDVDAHEAPLIIGHPKNNAPAQGWVKSPALSPAQLDRFMT